MTKDEKLWKQYSSEIDKKNKKHFKKITKINKELSDDTDRFNEEREANYKRRVKAQKRKIKNYNNLSSYKKLFTDEPYNHYIHRPMPIITPFSWHFPIERKSYQGFMDWKVKQGK